VHKDALKWRVAHPLVQGAAFHRVPPAFRTHAKPPDEAAPPGSRAWTSGSSSRRFRTADAGSLPPSRRWAATLPRSVSHPRRFTVDVRCRYARHLRLLRRKCRELVERHPEDFAHRAVEDTRDRQDSRVPDLHVLKPAEDDPRGVIRLVSVCVAGDERRLGARHLRRRSEVVRATLSRNGAS
jgi:hypothetical protein